MTTDLCSNVVHLSHTDFIELRHAKSSDKFFTFRVTDDSLSELSIGVGDTVVVREMEAHDRACDAEVSGELVAAHTPDGYLLKHIYFDAGDVVRFESANANYEAVKYRRASVRLIGVAMWRLRII